MLRASVLVLAFALTFVSRIWGISEGFSLLRDQIRDWEIALRPLTDLPLVGPATHVGGYTIGPAFYWILWSIRVTVGPWFDYLPHGGGIGQAALHSAADVLLLLGVWRRTGSVWVAILTVGLVAFSAFDLSFSAVIWNPVVGATLAKAATALILLDWHRGSALRAVVLAAVAWSAVHAYTGAVYVAVGVFAALVFDPLFKGERALARRNVVIGLAVVGALQVPYLVHRVTSESPAAMGAVTGSVARVLSGSEPPQIGKSVRGYVRAAEFLIAWPRHVPFAGWILLFCSMSVAWRYRRDAAVLAIVVLPQVLALIGYALFLAELDHYYYLSLLPAAVLAIVFGVLSWPPPRARTVIAAASAVMFVALVPERLHAARSLSHMQGYDALVKGSRRVASLNQPVRAIQADFDLPPTADAEFIYRILGGRIDRGSPWLAAIAEDGRVTFRKLDQP